MKSEPERQKETHKITLIVFLLAGTCLVTFYYHQLFKTHILVTHLYYIPIILAAFWWRIKGLSVAVLLAVFLLFHDLFVKDAMLNMPGLEDYFRAFMFLVTGVVVSLLSEMVAKTQKRFIKSEEQYSALFERSLDCIYIHDFEGNFIDANHTALKLFGYEKKDISSLNFASLLSSDQIPLSLKILEEIKTTGFQKDLAEVKLTRKNGETVYMETKGSVIYRDKTPYAIQGIARDITERKQTNNLLRESERRLSQAILGNSIPTFILDNTHTITHWNKACENLTGFSITEMVGTKNHWSAFYAEERPGMADLILNGATEEEIAKHYKVANKSVLIEGAYEGESFFPDLGEKGKWLFLTAAPLRGSKGDIVGVIETIQDVTQKRSMAEQLQQAQKMEAIGTLAGGIAHDFNNILFPIVGFTEMMLDNAPEGSELRENLNEVLVASFRARDLVQQILAFSRQAGSDLKPVKIQIIIEEVIKLMKASLPSTIAIEQYIDKDYGMVLADPTHIHQIAMNLMTNAYHAMEEDGGTLTIELSKVNITTYDLKNFDLNPGTFVCFSVSDTGHGIEKHVLNRIFEPYFTTKTEGKGTGLGLSVIHGIVKSYKGDIHVYSEPGKGSVFKVYLPVIDSKREEARTINDRLPVQGGVEHILLVDDEEPVLKMEKQMLEGLGYRVTSRTSSTEALEAFRSSPAGFDLVITDMTMPNMTGDKLAFELKQIRKEVPVILCTGFSEKMSKEKAKALGIDGFLMKPIVKSDLAQKIRTVLDVKKEG